MFRWQRSAALLQHTDTPVLHSSDILYERTIYRQPFKLRFQCKQPGTGTQYLKNFKGLKGKTGITLILLTISCISAKLHHQIETSSSGNRKSGLITPLSWSHFQFPWRCAVLLPLMALLCVIAIVNKWHCV